MTPDARENPTCNTFSALAPAGLYRAACAYVVSKEQGDDLSQILPPLVGFFEDIASGRLLPEVALDLAGSMPKLRLAATLVPEEQRKLLAPTVPLAFRGRDGTVRIKELPTGGMTNREFSRLIDDGKLLTFDEQVARLPAPAEISSLSTPECTCVDVWPRLTVRRRKLVLDEAKARGIDPEDLIVAALIALKVFPGKMPAAVI